jgi:hypothetical protein
MHLTARCFDRQTNFGEHPPRYGKTHVWQRVGPGEPPGEAACACGRRAWKDRGAYSGLVTLPA